MNHPAFETIQRARVLGQKVSVESALHHINTSTNLGLTSDPEKTLEIAKQIIAIYTKQLETLTSEVQALEYELEEYKELAN